MRTLISVFLFSWCGWCSSGSAQEVSVEHPKEITNSIGMKLVLIPKGTFTMGSPEHEVGRLDREVQHEVTISKDYYLGACEVTQAQYEKVMGKNPSHFQGMIVPGLDTSNHPVEMVSWKKAVEFCQRLSELPEEMAAGRVYRLPTEAEWEYGCRAGSQSAYCYGDDASQLPAYAWFRDNSNLRTHAVGQKKANAWGLYDMHGNVMEWCGDWRELDAQESPTAPTGPAGANSFRMIRGGWCGSEDTECRSAFRALMYPYHCGVSYGFRLVLVPAKIGRNVSTPQSESVPNDGAKMRDREPEVVTDPSTSSNAQLATITNSLGMIIAQLPAGTFTMGERDQARQVTLTKPFHFGVHEVTQEQYMRVMGKNPSFFVRENLMYIGDTSNHPVEMVSWQEAVEFCQRLSELPEEMAAGRVYRLPTEAEWEYACRAGTTARFSFGDDESQLDDFGWFIENSGGMTHPVGKKQPNAWGLYDMHGNVWEWCADSSADYPKTAVSDPKGPATSRFRGICGGSLGRIAADCGSTSRLRGAATSRYQHLGFRVALSPPDNP